MKQKYTIVVPVYYNATTLHYVMEQIDHEVFAKLPEYEGRIIFVDDGSGDNSWDVLQELRQQYGACVQLIKLSRNFGQMNAAWCGMEHAQSPVIFISADGQEPPSLVIEMVRKHFEEGAEVVMGTRASREETWWRRFSSRCVYAVMKKLSNKDMPAGGFDICLLGEKARQSLLASNWQPQTFLQVRILNLGFSRAYVPYHREDRKGGTSKWTFAKKLTYTLDGILGHSYVPIRAVSVIGILFAALSFLLSCFFFVSYLFNPQPIRGWTPIILLILFTGGTQMVMIGMVGEYLWRVLTQARQDPPYIVEREVLE